MTGKLTLNNGHVVNVSYNVLLYSSNNIQLYINFNNRKGIELNDLLGAYLDNYRISDIISLLCNKAIVNCIDTKCV